MAIPEWVSGFVALGTALPTTDFRLPTNGAIPVAVLSYSRKMFPNLPYFQNVANVLVLMLYIIAIVRLLPYTA